MLKKLHLAVLCSVLLFAACKNDESLDPESTDFDTELENALRDISPNNTLAFFKMPASDDFSEIPQDPRNPLTVEKVALGKLLYHETGLAINPMKEIGKGEYSCASCHFASAGFQAGRFQGIAEGGIGFGINGEGRVKGSLYPGEMIDVQPIRTPSAMNGAYQELQLWNGQFGGTGQNLLYEDQWTEETPIETNNLGYEGLEIQAIAGLKVHRLGLEMEFLESTGYKAMFDEVFADVPVENRYTNEFAGLAIAAYERTMLANQAPFQKWLQGSQNAMSELEKQGAVLFFKDAACGNCHTGPALNSMEFHAYGMPDLYTCGEEIFQANADSGANLGRGSFTKLDEDMYKFKVPQLYNLADSPFYGHGSNFTNIKDVVDYKNSGQSLNVAVPQEQLAEDFKPLNLTDGDVLAIAAFLEKSLRDPNLERYVPDNLLSGNCFPNADPLSANQLGCE